MCYESYISSLPTGPHCTEGTLMAKLEWHIVPFTWTHKSLPFPYQVLSQTPASALPISVLVNQVVRGAD